MDDVFEALDLDPAAFRTEGGAVNRAKLRAALLHPAEYLPSEHWLQESGWTGWACQYPDRLPRLYGAREIAELNWDAENGDRMFFVRERQEGAV